MKRKVIKSSKPKKGDIKIYKEMKYVFNGSFWTFDEIIHNTIDRHHTYSRNNRRQFSN